MFFDNNFQQTDSVRMDGMFYGLPSESKLVTYMNRQNVTTPTYGLTSGLSKISLDSPISNKKVQVTPQSPEFIPSRVNSSPNFYSPYSVISGGLTPLKQNNITPILGGNNYSTTPNKGRNLLRGDSPPGSADSPKQTPQSSPPPSAGGVATGIHQENVGGTTYFYPTSANHSSNQVAATVGTEQTLSSHSNSQSLNFTHPGHVYPGPASNVIGMQPRTQLSSAFFIPDEMRNDILARNEIANLVDTNPNSDLEEIENYHSLYPLETPPVHPKLLLPSLPNFPTFPSSTYKATHNSTGIKYCLRRLHGFRLQSKKCLTVVDQWKRLQHSNVVQLKEVFTTKGFGDQSLVLVYDYHPGSQTLLSKYFTPTNENNGYTDPFQGDARPFSHKSNLQRIPNGPLLQETEIWAIIMQLTAGLRAIHQAGLACRTLDPTKITITGKRVRFSFLGISDIVFFDHHAPHQTNQMSAVSGYQQDDLTSLGKLVLALSCRCYQSVQEDKIQSSIAYVTRNYSSDLKNLIIYLLTTTSPRRCVTDLMPMIGARFYTQLDALQTQCDKQEDELAKELENGRLYRMLVKLGCINERPEVNLDGTWSKNSLERTPTGLVSWSETGDRYMLKLFRDYLFHMITEDGRPWLDHAHILQCLNKLDAGTTEKVNLMSRDEQSVLVVTYAELKHCLEQSFAELTSNV